MKSPEISIRFAFCSSISWCGTNREQIFRLPKSSLTMVCTVSLLMPNSSAINLKVTRRSCASICLTRSIISGVLLVDGQPEHGSSSVVSVPSRKRLNHRKHIFCSRLPSRTLAPTFHASLSPFSLICSRTWCSLIAPLHCDATSHTDHVWLPTAGLAWRSRVLYARWRFSMYLWIAMRMRAHLAHVAIEISDHSPNFLDTPHIYIHF